MLAVSLSKITVSFNSMSAMHLYGNWLLLSILFLFRYLKQLFQGYQTKHFVNKALGNYALGSYCLAVTQADHCSEFRMPKYLMAKNQSNFIELGIYLLGGLISVNMRHMNKKIIMVNLF